MEVMLTKVLLIKKKQYIGRGIRHYLSSILKNRWMTSPSYVTVETRIKLQYKNEKLQLEQQAPTTTHELLAYYIHKKEYYTHQLLDLATAMDSQSQIKALVIHKIRRSIVRTIVKLQGSNPEPHNLHLQWSASRVGLVELLYAFHAIGAFNNGSATLTDIAKLLENSFNVSLGQFHRAYIEIKERKIEHIKFLKQLTEALLQKIDNDDAK
jgi:hypothetical protein